MNDNPYEAPNSPQYVTREEDPYRNAGMPSPNPENQPLFVPKRFGYGVSFNWNNPRAGYLFFGFLAFILVVAVVVPVLVLLLRR